MKKISTMMIAALAMCLFVGNAYAESTASKTGVCYSQMSLMKTEVGTTQQWVDIMKVNLHTSSQKDLVITPSLECLLTTDTKASTKGGNTSTATANARIRVRVLVDGNMDGIVPNAHGEMGVAYCERTQTLSVKLQGILSMCKDLNGDTFIDPNTECSLDEESVQLILDTASSHAFSFLAPNVGVGDHIITIQALIDSSSDTSTTDPAGSASTASATAAIGVGTVIVDEVRLAAGNTLTM